MNTENTFSYTYSACNHQEVLEIRKKYLPQEESKLDELMQLDHLVQMSGVAESLCVGIVSCLVFGTGMCFAMGVLGQVMWLGILLGLVGTAGMLAAFPVYRRRFNRTKAKYTPRILELTDALCSEN